jgi:hypothetical protein
MVTLIVVLFGLSVSLFISACLILIKASKITLKELNELWGANFYDRRIKERLLDQQMLWQTRPTALKRKN